jgi:hypothetical protein
LGAFLSGAFLFKAFVLLLTSYGILNVADHQTYAEELTGSVLT